MCSKETRVVTLEVVFEPNINVVADLNNVSTVAIWETQDNVAEELSEGALVNLIEESHCGEKDEVPEEVKLPKIFALKELSDISWQNLTKDKILESEPSLERGMTVLQGLRKRFTPHYKIYNEKKARAFQTIRDKFFFTKKTL